MRAVPCRCKRWSVASALLGLAVVGASACSPVLAAKQPSRRDVDLLNPGVPRNLLLAELAQVKADD